MEKFYRRSGNDPWVNPLVPNDSFPAKFGHLNAIIDELNKGNGITLKVYLTPTQHSYDGVNYFAGGIKTANSIPIDIGLPASGVGFYYRVTAFDVNFIYGSVTFDGGGDLYIASTSLISAGTVQFKSLSTTGLSVNTLQKGVNGDDTSGDMYDENGTISIYADLDSAVGDSTIDCYITVVKVAL